MHLRVSMRTESRRRRSHAELARISNQRRALLYESGSEAARVWSVLVNVKIATAPRMASASTYTDRVTALLMPDATPECCDETDPMTVVVSGATVMPIPRPMTRIAGKYVHQ